MRQFPFSDAVETLINLTKSQFVNRTEIEGRRSGKDFRGATLDIVTKESSLWFVIKVDDKSFNITVPVPFVENGVVLIESNGVKRAVCDHFEVKTGQTVDYLSIMQKIFLDSPEGFVTLTPIKKYSCIQQLAYSILNNNTSIIVYNTQKAINEIINKMPLHETFMNSWVMNNRLICVDPEFDILSDPSEILEYQVNKNMAYHKFGWTSVGLSDGVLATKNYILTHDLRRYTPFGLHHHNPQRNLYSTLAMKGDEDPIIRTESSQALMDKGIKRKGWNLFTVYVDLPDNFEDQLMVDTIHANKYTVKERKLQCFGEVMVKEGDKLYLNTPIAKSPDGEIEYYNVRADESWVHKITESITTVGNIEFTVNTIIVKYKRCLKDGTKLTNTHGNKGVIRIMDLGYAIDPSTGLKRKIDIAVSAKTIGKRKNFGQVLEAMYNNLNERTASNTICVETQSSWGRRGVGICSSIVSKSTSKSPFVISDNFMVTEQQYEELKDKLEATGIPRNGIWECHTNAGEVTGVCGTIFWGVIKDVEDQLWDETATTRKNGKGLRTAGLKFSTVEFRALETRLGKNNAVIDEILSYTQGTDIVSESIAVLRSKTCVFDDTKPIVDVLSIKSISQENGTAFNKETIKDTIGDDDFYADGFIMQIPITYQTAVARRQEDHYEGAPMMTSDNIDWEVYKMLYNTNRLYVPKSILRGSYKHESGLYKLNDIANLLNNIIVFSKRYVEEPNETYHIQMLYRSISSYYSKIAASISTKKGSMSLCAMSVRYPFSAKAVATLSNTIAPNTVQIYSDMAKVLKVKEGDVVVVERFPCLGFMGVRLQRVTITDDIMCKYTIRASGNSLVSTNLDFDGDVIYIAAFHTTEAKEILNNEFNNPNKACYDLIHKLNTRKGEPRVNCLDLDAIGFKLFQDITDEENAAIVRKLTGVKSQTGPVIAMAYNLMRIIENSGIEYDRETEAGIEMFIEKAGQSVFNQKHGCISLCEIVLEAVCTGDAALLIEEGFDPKITTLLCDLIIKKAKELGVEDIKEFHEKSGKNGSNIINKIIRANHRIYFASRSILEGCQLLECLEAPAVDLPSRLFKTIMSGKYTGRKTMLDIKKEEEKGERRGSRIKRDKNDAKLLRVIKDSNLRYISEKLFKIINVCMAA